MPGVASGNEIAHQLHVLQTLMLNVLEEPMNRPIESGDVDALEKIKELRRIAFDNDGSDSVTPIKDVATRKQVIPRDFRKLGFKNDATPLNDFGKYFCFFKKKPGVSFNTELVSHSSSSTGCFSS